MKTNGVAGSTQVQLMTSKMAAFLLENQGVARAAQKNPY